MHPRSLPILLTHRYAYGANDTLITAFPLAKVCMQPLVLSRSLSFQKKHLMLSAEGQGPPCTSAVLA